jgi:hypothetical protein
VRKILKTTLGAGAGEGIYLGNSYFPHMVFELDIVHFIAFLERWLMCGYFITFGNKSSWRVSMVCGRCCA